MQKNRVSAIMALAHFATGSTMEKPIPSPTREALLKEYSYDPVLDIWHNLHSARPRRWLNEERYVRRCRHIKSKRRIEPANNYLYLTLGGYSYAAHRLVWLYHHGKMGPEHIDHIDGKKWNNKIENLRLCTPQQNACNRGKPENNTSGFKGVHWNDSRQRWAASITTKGCTHNLGLFRTAKEAHRAYCDAATKLHGEFANFG